MHAGHDPDADASCPSLPILVTLGGTTGLLAFVAVGAIEALILLARDSPSEPWSWLSDVVFVHASVGALVGVLVGLLASRMLRRRRELGSARLLFLVDLALALGSSASVHLIQALSGPGGWKSGRGLALLAGALVLCAVLALGAFRFGRRRSTARAPNATMLMGGACLVLVGGLGLRLWNGSSSSADPAWPNVVLVVLDTTRVDRLSAYGYARPTTPALERLASEGARFTRAYSAAEWTAASHASIFTGAHVSVHGVTRESAILDEELGTLAESLGERGMRTAAFVKKEWLNDETGILRGFETTFDLTKEPPRTALLACIRAVRGERAARDKGAAEINATAFPWLARHADHPFFAFFNYNEAHANLRPPPELRRQFLSDATTDWGKTKFPENHAFNVGDVPYTQAELDVFSELYDAEIAYQDRRLGELVDFLRSEGILERTLLIVTADHGENLGEKGRLGHELSIANTLLHVPLLVRYPRRIAPGTVVDEPVEIRLLRGLVNSVVLDPGSSEPLDGPRLARVLRESPDPSGIVSELFRPWFESRLWASEDRRELFDVQQKSLILGSLKYVWSSDEKDSLFDLSADPREEHNLVLERPELRAEMLARLLEDARLWQNRSTREGPKFGEEMLKRLKAMGY